MSTEQIQETVRIEVENIGGIDDTTQEFTPGTTVLTGRNATNRTSFLRSIMAALGSTNASLKADADEGHVTLQIGDEEYTRTLTRRDDGSVSYGGDPFAEDTTAADLFAFLIGQNKARETIRMGASSDQLRDVIMAPVDTDELEAEIRRLQDKKNNIDTEIRQLEGAEEQLPKLEEKRQTLKSELEEQEAEISEIQDEIDELDASVEESREKQEEFDKRTSDLQSKRSELQELENEKQSLERSLEDNREELQEVESELEEITGPEKDVGSINSKIEDLRDQRREKEKETSTLQEIIQFNEKLANGELSVEVDGEGNEANEDLTDQLLEGNEVSCWACGQSAEVAQVESTTEALRNYRSRIISDINEIEDEIDELESEKSKINKQKRKLDDLREKRNRLEKQIDRNEEKIESRTEEIAAVEEEISELEDRVDELDTTEEHDKILELQKEKNTLTRNKTGTERDLESVEQKIETIQEEKEERQQLEEKREDIDQELTQKRQLVGDLEDQATQSFNDHMDEVLDLLSYENVERVWVEAKTLPQSDTRFELHVVRQGENDVTLQDDVENLSESEREVVGLVFALTGYLAHEVYEDVPFMLLDSLEAIDADRIAKVVDYFSDYAEYRVVALLPEDVEQTKNLDHTNTVITEI